MGTKRTLILCILPEKHNRLWNYFLCLHLLVRLKESRVNFVGLPIKVCAQDTSRVKIYQGQEPRKQQDVAGHVCSCKSRCHSTGESRELRLGQQFRIYWGTHWLGEALLQHFNGIWAEYFAFLCIKPHSAGMRLCPLWDIIYIKISPASQQDFHVPPAFRRQRHICVWG